MPGAKCSSQLHTSRKEQEQETKLKVKTSKSVFTIYMRMYRIEHKLFQFALFQFKIRLIQTKQDSLTSWQEFTYPSYSCESSSGHMTYT